MNSLGSLESIKGLKRKETYFFEDFPIICLWTWSYALWQVILKVSKQADWSFDSSN